MIFRKALLILSLFSFGAHAAEKAPVAGASEEQLEAFLAEFRDYQKLLDGFKGEMGYLVNREVDQKKKSISGSYDQATRILERKEAEIRVGAIARHKQFLLRYPDHPDYTPDAMFRLAELYYEKAQVDYSNAEERFDEQYDLYRRGKVARPPKAPMLTFASSIELYEQIIARFPTYRYIDSAFYLLGYSYLNMDRFDDAIKSYEGLVTGYPESRHIDEGLLRLGELYFDIGEWSKATRAYAQVLKHPDSKFFELAFYKMAWSYANDDQYQVAINKFMDLIDHYASDPSKAQDDRSAMLRAEVIEYVAKTLAEDDWDGDGLPDPDAGVTRGFAFLAKERAANREILRKYADTLYDLHERPKYFEAIKVYQKYLSLESNAPDDPEIQERIIAIYDILGDVDGGIRERKVLVDRYGKDGDWYQANATNATAIQKSEEFIEKYSQERALALHANAQKTKMEGQAEGDQAKLNRSSELYGEAALAYLDYLGRYPHAAQGYDLTYYLADSLYYSKQYPQAAVYYAKVRDWPDPEKNEYLELSAFSTISCQEEHIERLIDAGKLPKWSLSKEIEEVKEAEGDAEEKKGGVRRVTAKAIPEAVLTYVAAMDSYVSKGLNRKDDPDMQGKLAYKAAEVFLRFKNYDEARKRFEVVLNTYPKQVVGAYAAANIINTYWEENDIQNVKKWAKVIDEKDIGKPEERKKWKKEIRMFEMGAQFETAMKFLAEKKNVEAAKEFISLVDANPDFDEADKALLNAALALQDAHRYEESARVFERIVTEPKFKKSKYLESALFNLAENYKRFYNFEKAIWGYRTLYDKYPKGENASYALYQAAELLEYNQQLEEAIDLFKLYVKVFPEREETPGITWRIVMDYEKMGDEGRYIQALETFIKQQYTSAKVSRQVLGSHMRLATIYRLRGDSRKAKRYYEKTLEEFKLRAFEMGGYESKWPAEAVFQLLEERFEEYQAIQVVGSLEKQGKAIQQKRKLLAELEVAYADIFPYKSVDWTVSAFYRVGRIWQLLAKAVYEAPIPDALSQEEVDIYRMQLEDIAMKWENTAIERYELTIKNAREMNVMNEWTKKTLARLNEYKPTEYPLFKEEKRFFLEKLD